MKDATISPFRVPQWLKDAALQKAETEGRTLADVQRELMEAWVAAPQCDVCAGAGKCPSCGGVGRRLSGAVALGPLANPGTLDELIETVEEAIARVERVKAATTTGAASRRRAARLEKLRRVLDWARAASGGPGVKEG